MINKIFSWIFMLTFSVVAAIYLAQGIVWYISLIPLPPKQQIQINAPVSPEPDEPDLESDFYSGDIVMVKTGSIKMILCLTWIEKGRRMWTCSWMEGDKRKEEDFWEFELIKE